ncbi:sodium-dependent bicarbonate transport family permease [Hydrogenophilus islandicus]
MAIDPVPLFFVLGFLARLARSDLKIPGQLYETLSIYLLIAIGLKGGVELAKVPLSAVAPQAGLVLLLGATIPLVAFPILFRIGRLPRPDAAAIAGHYGSVSAVTFAVAIDYLRARNVSFEPYAPLFLVLLEIPGIVVGILLAKVEELKAVNWKTLAHEVLLGKSIVLLAGALVIGWLAGPEKMVPLEPFYFVGFKGALSLFLLEMGLVAAGQIAALQRAGRFLALFGVVMPLISATLGFAAAAAAQLSAGGAMLLATLAASASYIAAPAAMRIAVPEANPALSIGAALVVTFPFNILLGIPLYHLIAQRLYG